MTLRERYAVKHKHRTGQILFLSFAFLSSFVFYSTFARYEVSTDGNMHIAIANWDITVNDYPLTGDKNILREAILFVPTTNIDPAFPELIRPGQTGYFDLKINPANTEVSVDYRITIDRAKSRLPENMVIDSYAVNGGEAKPLAADLTVTGTLFLAGRDTLTADDVQSIRYFWSWADGISNVVDDYEIVAYVAVRQIL